MTRLPHVPCPTAPALPITMIVKAKITPLWDAAKARGGQAALAQLLGITPQAMGQLINCKRRPYRNGTEGSPAFMLRFYEAVGRHPDDIWPPDLSDDMLEVLRRPRRHDAEVPLSQLCEAGGFSPDRLVPPDAAVDTAELQATVDTVLRTLRPRDAEVLRARFGIGDREAQTLDEVGTRLGLSRERTRQIESSALKRLRRGPGVRRLKGHLGAA